MTALRLWDTCSYVRRFADVAVERAIAQDVRRGRFLLCSVVAMELYAGSRDAGSKRALDVLVRHLSTLDLLVSPDFADYQRVGVALRRYGRVEAPSARGRTFGMRSSPHPRRAAAPSSSRKTFEISIAGRAGSGP